MERNHYDIVIIDSGVDAKHPVFRDSHIESIAFYADDEKVCVCDDFTDELGHGTAVYGIIQKNVPGARILNVKLTSAKEDTAETPLVIVLEYIYEKIECRIVNISMGVRYCENGHKLYSVCSRLAQRGVVLVAAFDNDGYISYPAAFDCVIGVDVVSSLKTGLIYEYIEGSCVNIRWKKTLQRLPWTDSKYAFLDGTSFACAYVTSKIFEYTAEEASISLDYALQTLKKHTMAFHKIAPAARNDIPDDFFSIKRAAIFPFNKEMHALVRFREDLQFQITSVFDVRQSGRVGADCCKLIGGIDDGSRLKIENIEHINWELFDTIIIGHCDELNLTLAQDIRLALVNEAIKHNVNIFSLDPLTRYHLDITDRPRIHWPSIEQHHIPRRQLSKLYRISKPVLGIFGTSSSQGKLTLQMTLRKTFTENGYTVGCIGTEPTARLLGLEFAYPMGYNNAIFVTEHDSIQILNGMVQALCEAECEIIIAAGQSNSIPFAHGRLENYQVRQNPFILGVQPDIIILCINYFDSYEYIGNTIKYLEGISQACVTALVLFPMTLYDDWRSSSGGRTLLDAASAAEKCAAVRSIFEKPCYLLGDTMSMAALYAGIIEYLK